jgi:hypothetical protein
MLCDGIIMERVITLEELQVAFKVSGIVKWLMFFFIIILHVQESRVRCFNSVRGEYTVQLCPLKVPKQ